MGPPLQKTMKTQKKIILGTRGSPLALAQSKLFAESLQNRHPELEIELKKILTSGDRIQDRFLTQEGGKGLFVKEIEEALLRGEVDFAVHSLKDLPAETPPEFKIACFPPRLSTHDVLITRGEKTLEQLEPNAVIGTSSLRRSVQLKRIRPDLNFSMLRGNIGTRLRKLHEGQFDGVVLAEAGMIRLNIHQANTHRLAILPAPGQGCLAIEILIKNNELYEILKAFNDFNTERAVVAERRVMQGLGGECNLPMGVLGTVEGKRLALSAFIALPDGSRWIEESESGLATEPLKVADRLLEKFWEKGAEGIVEKIKNRTTDQ